MILKYFSNLCEDKGKKLHIIYCFSWTFFSFEILRIRQSFLLPCFLQNLSYFAFTSLTTKQWKSVSGLQCEAIDHLLRGQFM